MFLTTYVRRYYGTILLNQVMLKPRDKALAVKMIDIYFALFHIVLKQVGANADALTESKLLSELLTGINRAFPYAELSVDVYVSSFSKWNADIPRADTISI